MIKECIVLAGGLGTRLRSAVPDLPKCMAPVAGKPFLQHVVDYLKEQGIEHFIFSLGYMHEVIESFLSDHYPTLTYQVVLEESPMGTGGAILLSGMKATGDDVLIVNGDTLFAIDLEAFSHFHTTQRADCTLALKPMTSFDRYGVVDIDKDNHILSFREKQFYEQGLINGGVYALHIASLKATGLSGKFSFEKDYLEAYYPSQRMMGMIQDTYFIDIGIPEDFAKANKDLS